MTNIPNKPFSKPATNTISPVVRAVLMTAKEINAHFILQTELKER